MTRGIDFLLQPHRVSLNCQRIIHDKMSDKQCQWQENVNGKQCQWQAMSVAGNVNGNKATEMAMAIRQQRRQHGW